MYQLRTAAIRASLHRLTAGCPSTLVPMPDPRLCTTSTIISIRPIEGTLQHKELVRVLLTVTPKATELTALRSCSGHQPWPLFLKALPLT
jgi:hypothetical protein